MGVRACLAVVLLGGCHVVFGLDTLAGDDVTPADDAPPGSGCGPNILMCDDFEHDLVQWTTAADPADTIRTDSIHTVTGALALHVKTERNAINRRVFLTPVIPLPLVSSGTLAVRFDVFTAFDLTSVGYTSLLELDNALIMEIGSNFSDRWQLLFGDAYAANQSPLLGAWMCVEVVTDFDNQHVDVYAAPVGSNAGAPIIEADIVIPIGAVKSFSLGAPHVPDDVDIVELWFDDLVVGTERIGCQ